MNRLGNLEQTFRGLYDDLNVRLEVWETLNDVVHSVDIWSIKNEAIKVVDDLEKYKRRCAWLFMKLQVANKEKKIISSHFNSLKSKADNIRERVVLDIGSIIREGKKVNQLYEKISSLEGNISEMSGELEQFRSKIDSATKIMSNNLSENNSALSDNSVLVKPVVPPILIVSSFISVLHDLDDQNIFYVFSFLETPDILSSCQACKYSYARVYALFGISSQHVKPDWMDKPVPIPIKPTVINNEPNPPLHHNHNDKPSNGDKTALISVENNNTTIDKSELLVLGKSTVPSTTSSSSITSISSSASSFSFSSPTTSAPGSSKSNGQTTAASNNPPIALTREMADAFSKKLTGPELKVIISMTERLKKQSTAIEAITAEKEDVFAKMQNTETVRDFLVEKLRSAEIALKSALTDNNHLKKQAIADSEVISYLDIRGQELEGINADLNMESEQLRQTVDLQIKSHTALEEKLSSELKFYKEKNEEIESNHRSQKKLLVKEVKSLRSQIETISNERNFFKSHLQVLRDALSTSNIITNSNPSNRKSNQLETTNSNIHKHFS